MIYYILVSFSTLILSFGLISLKKPFFQFAVASASQLDIILDNRLSEEDKHTALLKRLGNLLIIFLQLSLLIVLACCLAIIPIIIFVEYNQISLQEIDYSSLLFFTSMILGSLILFIPTKKKKDYSDWSVLLHQLILDNYNISASLFWLEKKIFNKKIKTIDEKFIIVSGLARAGTTALTNALYKSNKFHSLSYANMPFLISPNLWRIFYKPKRVKLKQRAHGDKVMFGYNTIEALEEYFFKTQLNDSYIDEHTLDQHSLKHETYDNYLNYQKLIDFEKKGTTYLAKNNNMILRYVSMRQLNKKFKLIVLFREPLDHAKSLMKQHQRFSKLQINNTFTLEYMNWLAHHEFGLNHKVFNLGQVALVNKYNPEQFEYWVAIWINYYSTILQHIDDPNLILIDYSDFLDHPRKLLLELQKHIEIDLNINQVEDFNKDNKKVSLCDIDLANKANKVYQQLLANRPYKIIH